MAVIVNVLDPDVIVLGGGVSNIDRIYTDGRAQIEEHIFNDHFNTPVLKPKLGDAAGVIGAAYLTSLT
jgi:predicted NBD/HSP70 family sugar kinase